MQNLVNVYAIILAAGASKRLGRPKQLLPWRNRTLLEQTILHARSVLPERVLVVLGSQAETMQSACDFHGVSAIINENWQEGMAASIRAGVEALPASASAVLMLLCDQPLITARHLQSLLHAWQAAPDHIVASQYQEAPGVPAIFPAEFFQNLLALNGDRGAKALFYRFAHRLMTVPLPEAGLDIDREIDVQKLQEPNSHY